MIRLVKENRHLWHNSADGFTGNPSKRVKLFINIAEEIGTTAFEANRRFTSLRERYGKESKKLEQGHEISWPYFKDLNFLNDVIRRRDKRKSVKIEKMFKEEMETETTTVEVSEDYLEPMYEETANGTRPSRQKENPEVRYVTHRIRTDKPENVTRNEIQPMDSSIYLIEPEQNDKESSEDETVEAAFTYFKLELRKMDQKKREYCVDKMMMAFLNAKVSYPK